MRVASAQRLVVAILCGSLGCQSGPGLTALRPGGDKTRAVVPGGTLGPAVAREPAATAVQQVSYNAEAPIQAAATAGASSTRAVTLSDSAAENPEDPAADIVRSFAPGSEPTFYIESAVMRGQTPLRDFFVSDRFLIASIIVAAIVIPFAVHDSRQPNPPHNGTQ